MVESGDLNEFFEQILHTERSLSSRNTKLRKLKEEIQSCIVAVDGVQREMATQQGELAVRNVKMVDEEVEAKLLILREGILEQQCKQLLGVNRNLSVELDAVKLKLESEREEFLEEMREFGKSYDLAGAGTKHREQIIQKKVSTLQDEVLLLEAEMEVFECEKEEVTNLEQKLADVEKILEQKQEQKKLLERGIEEDEEEIKQLREECDTFGSKPSTDPEVIKLQKELEECKDCPEEKMYHSLHRELEELQRLCYHKQMKQHISRRNTQTEGTKRYNPYIHTNTIIGRRREENHGGNRLAIETIDAEQREKEGEDGGDRDGEEEGWDDELEAAELASLHEKLSVSDMEWLDEEVEEEKEEEYGSRPGDNIFQAETNQATFLVKQNNQSGTSAGERSAGHSRKEKMPLIKLTPHKPQQTTCKAVRTVVKRQSNNRHQQQLDHLAHVTDSPASLPPRKSSGQSIFKVPGMQDSQPLAGVPKTAKRVRFRY